MAALDLVKNLYNLLKLLLIMDVVMIHEREVIELFCRIDDFAEEFAALERKDLLPSSAEKIERYFVCKNQLQYLEKPLKF